MNGIIVVLQDAACIVQEVSIDDIQCDEFLIFQSIKEVAQQISVYCCKDVDTCFVLLPFLQGSIVIWAIFFWELGWLRENIDIRSKKVDKNIELYVPKMMLTLF